MSDHHNPKRKLRDILAGNTDDIRRQWDQTEAAAEYGPLPGGTYEAHVDRIELHNAKTGTPGAKLVFKVADGEHAGRLIWHDCWITPAALPQTKRDLAKLGIMSMDQLESKTIPPGRIRCAVRLALRTEDDGTQRNRVIRFDVLRVDDPPPPDPFAPGNPAASVAVDRPYDPEDDVTPAPADTDTASDSGALFEPAPDGNGELRRPADSSAADWARR